MYPPGHIAINILLLKGVEKVTKDKYPLSIGILLALLPDIVDKPACDYLHLAPYGRNFMHNLTAVIVCSLFVYAYFYLKHNQEQAKIYSSAWTISHLGHFLGDFVFIPWFWPWFNYKWPYEPHIAKAVTETVFNIVTGHKISPFASAIWNMSRIYCEVIFLFFVLIFLFVEIRKIKIIALFLSILVWAYIDYKFDWFYFVYNLKHSGIII